MKNSIIYLGLFIFSFVGTAQVKALKIGNNLGNLNSSAALEIESTTKGLLPPRMTQAQRDLISSPAEGLVVYCDNCSPKGMYLRSEGTWSNLTTTPTFDATSTVKGKILLAGDLTGTATLPTIANNAITSSKLASKSVTADKLDAQVGDANRILVGNATGVASWVSSPFSTNIRVAGASNIEIRGNGNWVEDAFELPYFTSTADLTKGLYMYVNSNPVYHDVKTNSSDSEASIVSIELNTVSGSATSLGSCAIVDAGTYVFAQAGQVLMFNVTTDTASVKFRYRPRTSDNVQSCFKMTSGAFGGFIYKLY